MLRIGKKEPEQLWVGKKRIEVLWIGGKRVWESVRSCFGSGVWRGDKPWIGTEMWK